MDVPGHHPRRAQAEDAEKCSDKVFKFIAPLAQQLGVVYWLLGVRDLAATQIPQVQIVIEAREMRIQVLSHFLLGLFVLLSVQI